MPHVIGPRDDVARHRLPDPIRRVRTFQGSTVLLVLADMAMRMPLLFAGTVEFEHSAFLATHAIVWGTAFAGMAGIVASSRAARRMLTALGLSKHDATKVIELPNVASDPGWKNPQFVRILQPPYGAKDASRAPQTPEELADAITELNQRLRDAGFLADDECVLAAQSARAAIEALEREVQQLHQDLDPEEGPRLERRLALLRGGAGDPELRCLLEGQQAVLLEQALLPPSRSRVTT